MLGLRLGLRFFRLAVAHRSGKAERMLRLRLGLRLMLRLRLVVKVL